MLGWSRRTQSKREEKSKERYNDIGKDKDGTDTKTKGKTWTRPKYSGGRKTRRPIRKKTSLGS